MTHWTWGWFRGQQACVEAAVLARQQRDGAILAGQPMPGEMAATLGWSYEWGTRVRVNGEIVGTLDDCFTVP